VKEKNVGAGPVGANLSLTGGEGPDAPSPRQLWNSFFSAIENEEPNVVSYGYAAPLGRGSTEGGRERRKKRVALYPEDSYQATLLQTLLLSTIGDSHQSSSFVS